MHCICAWYCSSPHVSVYLFILSTILPFASKTCQSLNNTRFLPACRPYYLLKTLPKLFFNLNVTSVRFILLTIILTYVFIPCSLYQDTLYHNICVFYLLVWGSVSLKTVQWMGRDWSGLVFFLFPVLISLSSSAINA